MLQLVETVAVVLHQFPKNFAQANTSPHKYKATRHNIDFPSRVYSQTPLLILQEVVFSPLLVCWLLLCRINQKQLD